MYSTSSAYKTAIRKASRPYDTIEGTITFDNPLIQPLTVDGSNMPTNSITISKQCIDGGELMFGGVFLGTLKLSVITDLDRYAFYNASVELTYKIEVGSHTEGTTTVIDYEEIPLGTYFVYEADRPTDRVVLTAYDSMTLLDKELGGAFISGTPWVVLSYVSQQTGYPLAFTESDLSSYPNINYEMQVSEEQGITTYRGAVREACQLLGCFACDDRTGKLELRRFSSTIDLTLGTGDWYSLVPADYKSKYIGITITSTAGTWSKVSSDPNEVGTVMIIEDAPAWDYGSETAQQSKTDNLYNYLISIDEYTPCDMDMPSDPSFDCGDRLSLITRSGVIQTLITSIEWKFHQGMSITSEGTNPYLEGNTALVTESSRILNRAVEKSKLQFLSFTNAKELIVDDTEDKEIARLIFTPTANTEALVVATILVDVDIDDETETESVSVPITAKNQQGQTVTVTDLQGNPLTLTGTANNTYYRDGKSKLSVHYKLDGLDIPNSQNVYYAVDELESGQHVITVSYPLYALQAYALTTFSIWLEVDGGSVTIPAQTIQATLVGQEISDLSGWGGLIEGFDDMPLTAFGYLSDVDIDEDVSTALFDAYNETICADNIEHYAITSEYLHQISDRIQVFMETVQLKHLTENGYPRMTEDGKRRVTE